MVFALVLACASRGGAQSSVTIPADDALYQDVAVLSGNGFVDRFTPVARPLSRRALAQLLTIARRRIAIESADPRRAGAIAVANRAIARIARRAALIESGDSTLAPAATRPLAALDAEVASMSSPARAVPFGGLSPIDAVIDPLTANRGGRVLADGTTAALEAELATEPLSWLSIDGRYRLAGQSPRAGGGGVRGTLPYLYARAVLRNVAVEFGREQLAWGPGRVAGLALSSNAPGLDLVRVANDLPFALPGVLRVVGPLDAQLFLSDLGPHQNFPHAKLAGYRVGAQPLHWLAAGIDVLDIVGGRGSPPASTGAKIADLFPLIDAFITTSDFQFSNKLAGGDLRIALPARGAEVYWEVLWDDFDLRRVWSTMWQTAGQQLGIRVPQVTPSGSLAATAELHHLGLIEYQHGQFTSGVTRDRSILGDPLGPRGDAAYLTLDWLPRACSRVSLQIAGERRSNDQWELTVRDTNDNGYRFSKLQDLPEEWRHRVTLTWSVDVASRTRLELEGGIERATNFDFVKGAERTNALTRLALRRTF